MSILLNKNSKIIVQGFTGSEGTFHASQMIEYGTNVVGGVTPGKGGQTHLDKPVFNTVAEAVEKVGADTSIIFVPPAFADAIMEAAESGIKVIICITEGIPTRDMIMVKEYISDKSCTLVGPNCPGLITAEESKIGITPGFICKKGSVGILSRSGTLTYEAIDQVVNVGLGITTAVGIGGDPVIGSSMIDILKHFKDDDDTKGIVMIGEIGGNMENDAARWVKENLDKPVVSFIAGQTAPAGRRMGHAGAIISEGSEITNDKIKILKECGISVANTVSEIGITMKSLIG